MKNEELKQGTVFHFPYLWKKQVAAGITDSKERTCCLVFKSTSPNGERFLIIFPISDQKAESKKCLEITGTEKKLAGLDPTKPAYVHFDEFNFDPVKGSFVRKGSPKILGRFSQGFVVKITAALANNIKLKSAPGIDRRD